MSNVLVFEDNPLDADIIRAVAERCGHKVKVYPDAPKWNEDMNFSGDCRVVLDLRLFRSDAFDTLSHLAMQKFRGDIILVTSESDAFLSVAEQYGKSHGLKVRGMLQKPINADELETMLMPA